MTILWVQFFSKSIEKLSVGRRDVAQYREGADATELMLTDDSNGTFLKYFFPQFKKWFAYTSCKIKIIQTVKQDRVGSGMLAFSLVL